MSEKRLIEIVEEGVCPPDEIVDTILSEFNLLSYKEIEKVMRNWIEEILDNIFFS